MYPEDDDFDEFIKHAPRSLLKRTLVVDYLLGKGYLLSDLEALPPVVAKGLMREACRFATLRLVASNARENFYAQLSFQTYPN